jgi:hypothetical protein
VGERLAPGSIGNVKGHFEDLDFVDLHANILKDNNQSWVGWTTAHPIAVSAARVSEARAIVERKESLHKPWGWKDPRTTLFLDFWNELLPGARFVFLYRSPWEVADSIFRRGSDREVISRPRFALELWLHYNRLSLAFAKAHPEKSLVISNDALATRASDVISAMNDKFHLQLRPGGEELFDPEVMHREAGGSWRELIVAGVLPEAIAVYESLNAISPLPAAPSQRKSNPAAFEEMLTEWVERRALDRENKRLKLETSQPSGAQQTGVVGALRAQGATAEERAALLEKHTASLEAQLATSQQHAANLEAVLDETRRHAKNLETMYEEARRHAQNLEKLVPKNRQ